MKNFLLKKYKRKNQKGFSLVELMVVVAIIGILAAIAIPNYQKFQAKSRQTEAKITLGGLYTSQRIFSSEWNYLSADLNQIGFEMDGATNSRYRAGWAATSEYPTRADNGYNGPVSTLTGATTLDDSSTTPSQCNITNVAGYCNASDLANAFDRGEGVYQAPATGDINCIPTCDGTTINIVSGTCNGPCAVIWDDGILVKAQPSRVFTIGATGDIGGGQPDQWWIDSSKRLINTQSGIE